MEGQKQIVTALAFQVDGRLLAVGCDDGNIRIWDTSNLKAPLLVFRAYERHVSAVAFSPDGRRLVAAGYYDQPIQIWNTANFFDPPTMIPPPDENIQKLAISPNLRWLSAGGYEGTIFVWSLDPDELISLAQRACGRNLTRTEWAMYFGREEYRNTFVNLPAGVDFNLSLATSASDVPNLLLTELAAEPEWIKVPEMNLRYSLVDDDGIAVLTKYQQLEQLALAGTPITDKGMADLAKLLRLKELDISNTQITDAGLASLRTIKSLRYLFLKNTAVSEAGISQIRRALPKVRIVR
jgi:hypothetical protein